MFYSFKKCQLNALAGDRQLYITGEEMKEVESNLNKYIRKNNVKKIKLLLFLEANEADNWYRKNLLLANKDKYQGMSMRTRDISKVTVKVEMELNRRFKTVWNFLLMTILKTLVNTSETDILEGEKCSYTNGNSPPFNLLLYSMELHQSIRPT